MVPVSWLICERWNGKNMCILFPRWCILIAQKWQVAGLCQASHFSTSMASEFTKAPIPQRFFSIMTIF
jgi:hypothetical protein